MPECHTYSICSPTAPSRCNKSANREQCADTLLIPSSLLLDKFAHAADISYQCAFLRWERRPRREAGLPELIAARAPLFIHLLYKLIGVVRFLEGVGGRVKRNGNQDAGKNNADKVITMARTFELFLLG